MLSNKTRCLRSALLVLTWLCAATWAADVSGPQSYAVLPFPVRNADPSMAAEFCQRLSADLAAASKARVIGVNAVRAKLAAHGVPLQKRASNDLDECLRRGKALGVDAVVCGGIWGHGGRHVLTLRAAEVADGLIHAEITHIAKTPADLLSKTPLMAKAIVMREQPAADGAADEDAALPPEKLLEKAKKYQADREWGKALMAYREVRLTSLADEALDRRIDACYARLALDVRCRNKDTARAAKSLTDATGKHLLTTILMRVRRFYVTPQNAEHVAKFIAKQIRMLAESADARKRYKALADPAQRAKLLAAVGEFERVGFPTDKLDVGTLVGAFEQRLVGGHGTDLPSGLLHLEAIQGVLASLDKYSLYLPIERLRDLEIQTSGHFFGIGAEVGLRGRLMTIVTPLLKSPALKAGLLPGDRVVLIDGKWGPPEITLDQAVAQLRGPYGKPVVVQVVTEGAMFPVERRVVRGAIAVASVQEPKILDEQRGIGYVRLLSFRRDTAKDFDASIRALESQGMRAMVIDLRGNGGGLLDAAVKVSDLLVSEGTIVSTRGRIASSTRKYTASAQGSWTHRPVAVLVNGHSASASEIVASVVRDHKRGPLVGTRTVGKGSVQAMFRLKGRSGLKTLAGTNLTIARYYPPSGVSFDGKGLVPNIVADLKHPARRKLAARRHRRWLLHNVPHFQSRLSYWREQGEEQKAGSDVEIDTQLAMAVDALGRALETGSWLAGEADKEAQRVR